MTRTQREHQLVGHEDGCRPMITRSGGFKTKMLPTPPSPQTLELKSVIRAVLRFGDPDVADAIFQPPAQTLTASDGKRIYPRPSRAKT